MRKVLDLCGTISFSLNEGLFESVKRGKLSSVKVVVSQGAEANDKNCGNRILCDLACELDKSEPVDFLVIGDFPIPFDLNKLKEV